MRVHSRHVVVMYTFKPEAEQLLADIRAIPKEHLTGPLASLMATLSVRFEGEKADCRAPKMAQAAPAHGGPTQEDAMK